MLQGVNLLATNVILWRGCVWSECVSPVETGDHNLAPRAKQGYREILVTHYGAAELCSVHSLGARHEALWRIKPHLLSTNKLQDRLGDNINKAQRFYLKQKGHYLYKTLYSNTLMILRCG